MLKLNKKQKSYFDLEILDYSSFAREMTEDELLFVNGGAEVENSNEGVANATPGDSITRNDGSSVTLTQADIDYAQNQLNNNSNVQTIPDTTFNTDSSDSKNSSSSSNLSDSNSCTNRKNLREQGYPSSTEGFNKCDRNKKETLDINDTVETGLLSNGQEINGNNINYTNLSEQGYPSSFNRSKNNANNENERTSNIHLYKQRELEVKYGYPYGAPEYGSLCLATSIINLYVKRYSISSESVDRVMSNSKNKYISEQGAVMDMTAFSKRLADECNSDKYFDYVYKNPKTGNFDAYPQELTKNEFLKSNYEYGIGGFYHEGTSVPNNFSSVAHYEMIQNVPYTEHNPGVGNYELYKIKPVSLYNNKK